MEASLDARLRWHDKGFSDTLLCCAVLGVPGADFRPFFDTLHPFMDNGVQLFPSWIVFGIFPAYERCWHAEYFQ